ncbi:cation-translocating P-type ATPase [Bdellovibrio svalbardensis]|uniref:Cation-translocating P-type ATPase n=1 Tax=Bdellovibrio svalbardensis TaxID=2972972 RepID=A0ABT6DMP4_9BACT|nr:cation-translocating P-type ATPase [Bdellovibrio svalbardensis]MDG0818140.1 cation-translocating P-type ATPase [Bdellovibrio svalbardensis]
MGPQGLSHEEALNRLKRDGLNELPSVKPRTFFRHLLEILKEPMSSLLAACGIVYALIGDRQEAFILMGFWALIIFITLYQERKTENALTALRRLSSPRAWVIRDGVKTKIPATELVVDDLIQLSEGDIVPADAIAIESLNVQADESLLTGESFPVEKDLQSSVWAGTTLVRGQLIAQVVATGFHTKMGKIGVLLTAGRSEETLLKLESRQVVKRLSVVAILLCIVTAVAYALLSKNVLGGILVGLTLAMAILPNELPAVLTIFLALGTRRIAQRNVLTRRLHAVENIGATTVLCVDKTGTITLNKMEIQEVLSLGRVSQSKDEIIHIASLASNAYSFDPMERAIAEADSKFQIENKNMVGKLVFQFSLSSHFFAMSNVWQQSQGEVLVAAKGAPEAVVQISHLTESEKKEVFVAVDSMAQKGLRILAVASAPYKQNELPADQKALRLQLLGLVGFADPVRSGVKESIALCSEAGVRVMMMTGDHSKTASIIAQQIGLQNPQAILSGKEMERMSDEELAFQLTRTNCFARMIPEQKLRIVQILQGQGEVVAMTGDGVNDGPALMAAQIGIAMGLKGTDVAREAASMVLVDDDFTSIVQGIRTGRGIYDNLQAAAGYLLAIHIPIMGISILPVFLNLPLVLMPVHVAFLHLIIEPACSLVFESEPLAEDVMKRKPRNRNEKFFSRKLIVPSVLQGVFIYVIILAVFLVSLKRGLGELDARTLTFTTLIFANMGLIFINRSWNRSLYQELRVKNDALWWVIAGSLIILFLVLYVPPLRTLFRFSFLHPLDLGLALSSAFISIVWFEFWKARRS